MPPAHLPDLRDQFVRLFGRACTAVARAPGRVNLIGEHTDYNDGFVLPMALEQDTWVAAAARCDGIVRARSTAVVDEQAWPIDGWSRDRCPAWTAYVAGVAALLRARGAPLAGCDLLIDSRVPVGGGLSSSAALEVAAAKALAAMSDFPIEGVALADLARSAEHDFARVPCGIMDQFACTLARRGCALLIDCRSRTVEHIRLDLGSHAVLIVDSGVKHSLGASAYAQRQRECHDAVEHFRRLNPEVRALRDVTTKDVQAAAVDLPPRIAARARHVVSENDRTLAAARAMQSGDLQEFGRLMRESHESLRADYEVSCVELDLLVEIVSSVPGVLGARMTGGGFGGCIVALVHADAAAQVESAVRTRYDSAGHGPARLIRSGPGDGATVEPC